MSYLFPDLAASFIRFRRYLAKLYISDDESEGRLQMLSSPHLGISEFSCLSSSSPLCPTKPSVMYPVRDPSRSRDEILKEKKE